MSLAEIILIAVSAVLVIVCGVLFFFRYRDKKRISNLCNAINEYINNGRKTDFSVSDDEFARLQNGISDLQNMIDLERNNTVAETKKNTEFISDVSHQLKTPLAALRLYCEMDNEENSNGHTQKELQLIEKMENLVQNLLRLEKIKSDAYVMNFDKIQIRQTADELIYEFKSLFPEKRYSVTGDSVIRCDREWISEAISNVIKNASEHTEKDGTVEISISHGKKSTVIEIQDNGGGVEETELSTLFTRFGKTKNALPSSAGVGLAITKAIVEKHHGIISAENKNNGLCVTICIPHLDGYISI